MTRAFPIVVFGLLTPLAPASTWIVDDDGGAGVHFTSLTSAVAAAAPNDVLVVRPGSYAGFTLDRGLSILGDSATGVQITSGVTIHSLPALERVTLVNCTTSWIALDACAGAVLLELVTVRPLELALAPHASAVDVVGCADVRARQLFVDFVTTTGGSSAIRVDSSRLELSRAGINGPRGRAHTPSFPFAPEPGGPAVHCLAGSVVRVQRCSIEGGAGGNGGGASSAFPQAADGGMGIEVESGAECLVLALDPLVAIRGGYPGLGHDCPFDGAPGSGVSAKPGSLVRVSGGSIFGNANAFCGAPSAPVLGNVILPASVDPMLWVDGQPVPGQTLTYTIHGQPGAQAFLSFGRAPRIFPSTSAFEDQLLLPVRVFQLGTLDAAGTRTVTIPVPLDYPIGATIVAQATVFTGVGAQFERTPSATVTVR